MRRPPRWCAPCAACAAIAAAAGPTAAAPWTVTADVGGEIDTNVQRVETGPGLQDTPVTAPVFLFDVRADHRGALAGGTYALSLSDSTRVVGDASVAVENVTLLATEARYAHPVGDRPVSLGLGVLGADDQAISDPVGARTFTNVGVDLLALAHDDEDRRFSVSLGPRYFTYKPDHDYDWAGPSIAARFELPLWQSAAHTRTLELVTSAGFEARYYNSNALVDTCAPGAPPDPNCPALTSIGRRDRYQRAGAELTWTGDEVASIGYQVLVIDSNSYGESLVRNRITASATAATGHTFFSVLAILQLDKYLDGLIVDRDLTHTGFASVEDENRSSLQARVAHAFGGGWSLEARAAAWRNIGGGTMELSFHREVVYAGIVYTN